MNKMKASGLALVLVALAFVLVNVVNTVAPPHVRWDLTDNSLYTLSDGSREIVSSIEDPVKLKLYFSEKLTKELPSLRAYARRVEALLREYAAISDGKISVEVVNPEPFSEEEDEATVAGLQGVPSGFAGDQIFFGLVGESEGSQEVIPFFQMDKEEFLEYELSRLIYNLDTSQQPIIGVITSLNMNGAGGMTHRGEPWVVADQMEDMYNVRWLPGDVEVIDDDIDVLLLVQPENLSPETRLAIDQYVLSGGRSLVFVDPVPESDQYTAAMLREPQPYEFSTQLQAWGIEYHPRKVLGDYENSMTVGVGPGRAPARHIALLALNTEDFNKDDVIMGGLEAVNVSSAGIFEPVEGTETEMETLMHSSSQSGVLDAGLFASLTDPEDLMDELQQTEKSYRVAVRLRGKAGTAYPDGVELQVESDESDEESSEEETEPSEGEKPAGDAEEPQTVRKMPEITESENINVILVADTDVLTDRLWVQVQEFFGQRVASPWADNGAFLMNSLENLSGNSALISIRSRGQYSRPFTLVEQLRKQAEEKFRAKEQQLEERLQETEAKLAELEQSQMSESGEVLLSDEQEAALERFRKEKLRIRKELREVQHSLDSDIEELGRNLKLLNILLVPSILTFFVIVIWLIRRKKRAPTYNQKPADAS